MSGVPSRATNVGFVGVGHMGKFMANNLMRHGFQVTICDRRPEARTEPVLEGAAWADTPRAVAERSHTVITSLPGPTEVDLVVLGADGILAGAQRGDYYIDMTTSTPDNIRRIAAHAEPLGVRVLDAPVAGGIRGARKGNLTIMVGADQDSFNRCLPIFQAIGERIFLVGDVGAGHVAKLVNNMMTIANGIVAMEAMVVGAKANIDPARLIEVAQAGTGDSFALNVFPYAIFKGNFDPAKFALSLATKDLRISEEYADSLNVQLRVIPAVLKAMTDACAAGLADRDWSSYITLLEDQAGVQVRTRAVSQ